MDEARRRIVQDRYASEQEGARIFDEETQTFIPIAEWAKKQKSEPADDQIKA